MFDNKQVTSKCVNKITIIFYGLIFSCNTNQYSYFISCPQSIEDLSYSTFYHTQPRVSVKQLIFMMNLFNYLALCSMMNLQEVVLALMMANRMMLGICKKTKIRTTVINAVDHQQLRVLTIGITMRIYMDCRETDTLEP